MGTQKFEAVSDEALGERFRALMLSYDEACRVYDQAKAAEIHREFYAIEGELRRRRNDDNWRRTGMESMSIDEVVERFKERAVAYEQADGSDETEHFYQELEDAENELKRRTGDQRRILFSLYVHPDARVRYAAADATRTLAPRLSKHRLLNIEDDNWQPLSDGLDIERAGLAEMFPTRAKGAGQLEALSVEQLATRFVDLALSQQRAELHGEIAKQNRLIQQGWGVAEELKNRPGDRRSALLPLYDHPNVQVRLNAARLTLAIAPVIARRVIQTIADSKQQPQAMDAGMCLWALDQGISKTT